jgi:hypothetical protein
MMDIDPPTPRATILGACRVAHPVPALLYGAFPNAAKLLDRSALSLTTRRTADAKELLLAKTSLNLSPASFGTTRRFD